MFVSQLHFCDDFFLAPAIFDIGETVENTIAKDQSQYLQYDFPIEEGFTIEIHITFGELVIYGSFFIRSPTSLTADFQLQSESSIQYYISPTICIASVYTQENWWEQQVLSDTNYSVYLTILGMEDLNHYFLNTFDHPGMYLLHYVVDFLIVLLIHNVVLLYSLFMIINPSIYM